MYGCMHRLVERLYSLEHQVSAQYLGSFAEDSYYRALWVRTAVFFPFKILPLTGTGAAVPI